MSEKNLDKHGRLRSKTVAFRMSPKEANLLDRLVAISGVTKRPTSSANYPIRL